MPTPRWLLSGETQRYFGTIPPGGCFLVASTGVEAVVEQEAASMHPLYERLVRVCDGTADDVDIQGAIDALA